jgi:hypothetical protein
MPTSGRRRSGVRRKSGSQAARDDVAEEEAQGGGGGAHNLPAMAEEVRVKEEEAELCVTSHVMNSLIMVTSVLIMHQISWLIHF